MRIGHARIDHRNAMTDEAPEVRSPATPAGTAPAWMPVISELELDAELRSLACRFTVPRDLAVLEGHFPGLPVVPGIMQVGWAAELARAHLLVTGRCTGIATAKFRRLLLPGMQVDASLDGGSRSGQLQFSFQSGGDVVSTGRLLFGGSGD